LATPRRAALLHDSRRAVNEQRENRAENFSKGQPCGRPDTCEGVGLA
jgi:hypothetical protein